MSKDRENLPWPIVAAGPKASAAWKRFHAGEGLAGPTPRRYRGQAVAFLRWLAVNQIALTNLTVAHVRCFMSWPALTGNVRERYRATLRRLLSDLADQGIVQAGLADKAFPKRGRGSHIAADADGR